MSTELRSKIRKWLLASLGWLGSVIIGAYAMLKFIMDFVGRTTVIDDAQALSDKLPNILTWIAGTPSWVALLLLAVPAGLSFWVGFPALSDVGKSTSKRITSPEQTDDATKASSAKLQEHYVRQGAAGHSEI